MDFLGSLISGGLGLLGGIFGQNNQANIAAQNVAYQREFAQQGVTWRAEDATRAQNETGINRLALLGTPTNSFSNIVGDNSLGDAIGRAGQELGRAVTASTAQPSRADQLNEKLLEAKIANVNADTVRMTAAASKIATTMGVPGIPMPPPDPRGPVIPLMQRAWDPRTNEIVWIPSDKAASPLQTLAASPTNAALAGRGLTEGLTGWDASWGPSPELNAAAARAASKAQYDPYTPF